jgi:hypothetical protein
MATIKPRRGTSVPTVGTILQNELAVDTTNKRIYIGAADGSGTLIGSAPGGSDTQVQFNDSGIMGGDSGLTYNKTTDALTVSGDVAVNGGDLTTTATTFNLLATTATTINFGNAATTLTLGNTATAAQTVNMFTASTGASTYNFATGATASFTTKTLNIGTGGAAGSTTNINFGSSTAGTATFNCPLTSSGIFSIRSTSDEVQLRPVATTHPEGGKHNYAMTVKGQSWGFGPRIGTRRLDNNTENAGSILWDVGLIMLDGKTFSMSSNGANGFLYSTRDNDTFQIFSQAATGRSNAIAIISNTATGAANRSPTTEHTDPTLYIYAAGSTNANHFIRMNHNTTDGTIETGAGKLTLKAASNVKIEGSVGSFNLPSGDGTNGQVLSTNGSGVTSWQTVGAVVFDTKTANFSPVETDNGKTFVIDISGKTSITVTLDGLSVGWRAKFLVLGGVGVTFDSSLGTVLGTFGADGMANTALGECVEVHCYASGEYHAG